MKSTARQLPLDLPHRPAYGRDDFLVARSNQAAVALVDAWPDWPHTTAALYGPSGSGKTHLGQVWRQKSRALELNAVSLAQSDLTQLVGAGRPLLLAGLEEALAGDRRLCERLFHLYNMLLEAKRSLFLIGRAPPARWRCELPDLQSRLSTVQAVALGQPDEELIAAVLLKQFDDRQLTVSPKILAYLLLRMDRSFAAASRVVAAIDRASLARQSPIKLSLVREVLANMESRNSIAG